MFYQRLGPRRRSRLSSIWRFYDGQSCDLYLGSSKRICDTAFGRTSRHPVNQECYILINVQRRSVLFEVHSKLHLTEGCVASVAGGVFLVG